MKKYLIINPIKLFKILMNKNISMVEKLKSFSFIFLVLLLGYIGNVLENTPEAIEKKRLETEKIRLWAKEERKKDSLIKIEERIKLKEKCGESGSYSSSSGNTWRIFGEKVVTETWYIISVSLEMDEGLFGFHKLPKTVQDIDCDWAKDFIYSQSSYFRNFNVYLSYPKNEEFVECFCIGFETAAEKYILEKNN